MARVDSFVMQLFDALICICTGFPFPTGSPWTLNYSIKTS